MRTRHRQFMIHSIVLASLLTGSVGCSSEEKKPRTVDEEVQREIGFHLEDQEACFADYQKRKPGIFGDLTFRFEIARNGSVSKIEVREDRSNLHDKELRRCMIEGLKKIRFSTRFDQPVVVDAYPFHFRK